MTTFRSLLLWGGAILLISACHKPTVVGTELLPGGQSFETEFTDTFILSSSVERDTPVITSAQSTFMLGSLSDMRFGKAYAGIFTQLRLSAGQTGQGTLTLDSAVLVLRHRGQAYGDKTTTHDIVVYRVTENMEVGAEYKASRTFSFDATPIGGIDDYVVNEAADLRIPMTQAFGEMMLTESQTANFSSNDAFVNFFKGIYIAPDTSAGHSNSMMQIDLLSSASTIHLHYRNPSNDTLVYSFVIGSSAATQNHFTHNYIGSMAETLIADSTADDIETMIESLGGLRLKVTLPDITLFGDIAINKAELILTVIEDSTYSAPEALLPRTVNVTTGRTQALTDEALALLTTQYSAGGTLQSESVGNATYQRYRINLAKHMYLLHRGDIASREIVIQVVPVSQTAGRVRIGGVAHNDPNVRMKMNLTFTRLL